MAALVTLQCVDGSGGRVSHILRSGGEQTYCGQPRGDRESFEQLFDPDRAKELSGRDGFCSRCVKTFMQER